MSKRLSSFVNDAQRFLLGFRYIFEEAPLQIYSSALVFCPEASIVKQLFAHDLPDWIDCLPKLEASWPASLQVLQTGSGFCTKIIFSPDGQLLASVSGLDPSIRIWETSTGALRGTFEGPSDRESFERDENRKIITELIFLSTNQLLASATSTQFIRIWDNITGLCQDIVDDRYDRISAITYSQDGRLLASALEDDFAIKLWDPLIGTSRGVLEGHLSTVKALTFAPPHGQLLASASDDMTIRIWDTDTSMIRHRLRSRAGSIKAVLFSPPDGQILASMAVDDPMISLWDTSTGNLKFSLEAQVDDSSSMLFTPDGQLLVLMSYSTIQIWNSTTGNLNGILDSTGNTDKRTARISPDSQLLAVSFLQKIELWSLGTKAKHATLEGHSDDITCVQFSHDGRFLATGSDDETIQLWDVLAPKQDKLDVHASGISVLAFSPCGRFFASGSLTSDLRVWSSATGASRSIGDKVEDDTPLLTAISFSPDSQIIFVGLGDHVKLWDTATGVSRGIFEGHTQRINTMVFSPDGLILASGSDDCTIRLWDPHTGSSCGVLETSKAVKLLAFSNDGQTLASVMDLDRTIVLWDMETCMIRAEIGNGHETIEKIAFSSGSSLLALALDSNALEVWDIILGTMIHKNELYLGGNIAFNGDGSQLEVSGRLIPFMSYSESPIDGSGWTTAPYALDAEQKWVTFKGCKVLELPSDRRPTVHAIHKNLLVLGTASLWDSNNGRLTFFRFSTTVIPPGIE